MESVLVCISFFVILKFCPLSSTDLVSVRCLESGVGVACVANKQTLVMYVCETVHKFVFWNPVEYFIMCT